MRAPRAFAYPLGWRPPRCTGAAIAHERPRNAAKATSSLVADSEALAGHQATVSAARAKESVDCAGAGAAERRPRAAKARPSSGGGGPCASDVQAVSAASRAPEALR